MRFYQFLFFCPFVFYYCTALFITKTLTIICIVVTHRCIFPDMRIIANSLLEICIWLLLRQFKLNTETCPSSKIFYVGDWAITCSNA